MRAAHDVKRLLRRPQIEPRFPSLRFGGSAAQTANFVLEVLHANAF